MRTWHECGPGHAVYRNIAEGEPWFASWYGEAATPFVRLKQLSGVGLDRILAIDAGDRLTRDELLAFARAWNAKPEDVEASLPPGLLVG